MGSVRRAASLQAGVQGCNGGVSKNPGSQGPGCAGLWGTPLSAIRVAWRPACWHGTVGLARRASPAGPSTARAWGGRAKARRDKPSRFTTEACMSVNVSASQHITAHNCTMQYRLELRLSALSITSPADAHPCSRSLRWRYQKVTRSVFTGPGRISAVDQQFFCG